MGVLNAGVNDVDASTFTSRAVVGVVGGTLSLVGDAAKTPWGTLLGNILHGVDNAVLLNVFNLTRVNFLLCLVETV